MDTSSGIERGSYTPQGVGHEEQHERILLDSSTGGTDTEEGRGQEGRPALTPLYADAALKITIEVAVGYLAAAVRELSNLTNALEGTHWVDDFAAALHAAHVAHSKTGGLIKDLPYRDYGPKVHVDTIAQTPLSTLGLTFRGMNALARNHLYRVGDIEAWSDAELLAIRGFGPKSLRELRDAIRTLYTASESST